MKGGGLARQLLLYALMTGIWGSSFFFTALALPMFNPLLLVLTRMALATLVLAVIVRVMRLPLPRQPRLYLHFAVLGMLSIAFPYWIMTEAQLYLPSSTSVVLSSTTPIFVFLIATLGLRTERFTGLRVAGVLIAFGGVASLYGFQGAFPADAGGWALVIVGSSVCFALANVYTKRFVSSVHPFVVAFLQIGIGTLYLLPATALSGGFVLGRVDLVAVLAILELGILSSAVCYLLFFHFIATWGSTVTSLNTYLQPIVGILLGVLVLHEQISERGWWGMAVTVVGVIVFGAGTVRMLRRDAGASSP